MVRNRENVERAKIWITVHLKGCGGNDSVENIMADLRRLDLTKGEISQARKELGLTSERYKEAWFWYL